MAVRIISKVCFWFVFALFVFIDAARLVLCRNTLAGWGISAALFVLFLFLHRRLVGKQEDLEKKKKRRRTVLLFLGLAVCMVVVWKVTSPPERLVPATEERNPPVTEPVTVAQGQLTGVYTEDREVEVYAGIPYAKPPVGELRFCEPQEPEAWEGIRACDHYAPMAMQTINSPLYQSLMSIFGYHNFRISLQDNYVEPRSEDCLYLNVWKPAKQQGENTTEETAGEQPEKAPEKAAGEQPIKATEKSAGEQPEKTADKTGADEKLPVLVYIHGGSLMTGQSYYSDYRGEDLAKKGIIVVTCAYRLGVFGYYANEDLAAESAHHTTGNYGLLDQIQALRWVQENIEAFGGDPEKVTIAGESAGASSVNALCVSPLAKGLFRYAIADSSGIVAKHPYHTFRTREEALQMGQDIMQEMGVTSLEELRNLPAEKLVQTTYKNDSMMVDGYAITEQPYLTYEKGKNHEQALLNGFNAKEADAFLLDVKAKKENYVSLLEDVYGDYAEDAAQIVPPDWPPRDQKFIIDVGEEAKSALDHAYSAAWFTYSHELWSHYVTAEKRPVYEYYFTKTNASLSNFHAGELPYAYGNLWRHGWVYEDSDFALSEIMQQYWVNFVKTGDPNGEGLPHWEKRNPEHPQVNVLDTDIRMDEDPYQNLYPLLDQYQESLG